jgi:hypothetical protein
MEKATPPVPRSQARGAKIAGIARRALGGGLDWQWNASVTRNAVKRRTEGTRIRQGYVNPYLAVGLNMPRPHGWVILR